MTESEEVKNRAQYQDCEKCPIECWGKWKGMFDTKNQVNE